MAKTKTLHIRLTPEHHDKIRELSVKTHRDISNYIGMLIEEHIEEMKKNSENVKKT